MKVIYSLFLAFVLTISLTAQTGKRKKGTPAAKVPVPPNVSETPKGSVPTFETSVLDEMNSVRQNPTGIVGDLEAYKGLFKDRVAVLPGGVEMKTFEGAAAVDEAIVFLKKQTAIKRLQFSAGLSSAAQLQVKDLIENDSLGHTGKDGSDPQARIARFGTLGTMSSESIVTNVPTPREVVSAMVIDDGLRSRNDRRNLFNVQLAQVGIACGKNKTNENLCVLVFADSFKEKKAARKP